MITTTAPTNGELNLGIDSDRLRFARAGIAFATILAVALFIAGVPVIHHDLTTPCDPGSCQPWQGSSLTKASSISRESFARLFIIREGISLAICLAIAAVVLAKAGRERIALLAALTLISFGGATTSTIVEALTNSGSLWRFPAALLSFLGIAAFCLFFAIFPDGRFVPGWLRYPIVLILVSSVVGFFVPTDSPLYWNSDLAFMVFVLFFCLLAVAQVRRYRRVSNAAQREQTKWVMIGFASAFVGFFLTAVVMRQIPESITGDRVRYAFIGQSLGSLSLLLIPLSIALAILRHRLWDADRLVRRALVYGILTVAIVLLYLTIVTLVGALLPATWNRPIAIAATAVVAAAFQPLRTRLQRIVSRFLYGDRDDPYTALAGFGERLGAATPDESMLATLAGTVAGAMRVPYVAIALGDEDELTVAASFGKPVAGVAAWPLAYQGESLGELRLAPRAPGEPFDRVDRRLVDALARQVSVATHAARSTTELQAAHERLVSAREEERRRLRRDLHDGLGPRVASQTLILDAARSIMPRDPEAADALLDELRGQMQEAVLDIRRLVYALRPPALDDLGLVGALREWGRPIGESGPRLTVVARDPFPPLPAGVESAAYRIVQEAVTNVARHAGATRCEVALRLDDGAEMLLVDVSDDGHGLPPDFHPGVGLVSMRERATELGGTFAICSPPGAGTRVQARLPIRTAA